ncbi:MAG: ParA family protein, partial [Christensenellales bacterium]
MGKIYSFTNQKGGVGKTTTCINLAAYLALDGKKVLVVDMDPQGNATSGLGASKSRTAKSIYNVITGDARIDDESILQKTEIPSLSVLGSNIDLAGAEVELAGITSNRERIVKNELDKIKENYDYIFIDCPPSLGLLTVNALT